MLANALRSSRTSLSIASRHASTTRLAFARHESTATSEKLKEARKLKDKLQKDWRNPVLLYSELKPRTQNPSADAYLIDVREPDEVAQGSIPSSVNLPLSVLANSMHLAPPAFYAQHGFQKPRKDQEVVFYCRSGVRSATACDVAKRNGYQNVLNYQGSWLDWVSKESEKLTTA